MDRVNFDDEQVVRTLPNGNVETVRWRDLQQVSILTPAADQPLTTSASCSTARTARDARSRRARPGVDALLARLQRLPGFNNEAVIEAMGSTAGALFLCRTRAD